jgi:hypothetical protein
MRFRCTILHHVPKKQAMLRSIRVRVVPMTLHSVIFAAYHASAGNGHASFKAFFLKLRIILAEHVCRRTPSM